LIPDAEDRADSLLKIRLLVVKSMLGSAACSSSGESWSAERILGSGGGRGGSGGDDGVAAAALAAVVVVAAAGVAGAAVVVLLKARQDRGGRSSPACGLSVDAADAVAAAADPADAIDANPLHAAAAVPHSRARDASSSKALPAERGAAIAERGARGGGRERGWERGEGGCVLPLAREEVVCFRALCVVAVLLSAGIEKRRSECV
jgi:hypothetical protein